MKYIPPIGGPADEWMIRIAIVIGSMDVGEVIEADVGTIERTGEKHWSLKWGDRNTLAPLNGYGVAYHLDRLLKERREANLP